MIDEDGRGGTSRIGMSPRIAESIAADLRQRILRGEATGEPFPRQDDLIRRYGVSGPSLREALRILEAEGLITVRRGKFGGAHVHKPNWSSAAYALGLSMQGQGVTLADLSASILSLEPTAAAACAQRADRMQTLVPVLREHLAESGPLIGSVQYAASAAAFHDLMVAALENVTMRLLVRSLVAIWAIQEKTWLESAGGTLQRPEPLQRESWHEHVAILDLVEAGDADGVQRLVTEHLHVRQAVVLERFGDEVVDASSLAAVAAFKTL